MNIVSLQTFLAIIETGSLVRASQKMNVTQSTVTARLKALEDEVGQVLLNRQKSGTTLTPAGSKFQRYARIMTGIWRQAKFETGMPAGFDAVCAFLGIKLHDGIFVYAGKGFMHHSISVSAGYVFKPK